MARLVAASILVGSGTSALPGSAPAATLEPWTASPPPLFALDSLSEGRIDLASFNGRIVLVHFFATWCEPCRTEMASLQRLAELYTTRPVTILAVNVAEVATRVSRFFETQPVTFPILLDTDRAVTKAWRVDVLPTTVVLDTRLTPAFVANGDLDWNRSEIDHALTALLLNRADELGTNPTEPVNGGNHDDPPPIPAEHRRSVGRHRPALDRFGPADRADVFTAAGRVAEF